MACWLDGVGLPIRQRTMCGVCSILTWHEFQQPSEHMQPNSRKKDARTTNHTQPAQKSMPTQSAVLALYGRLALGRLVFRKSEIGRGGAIFFFGGGLGLDLFVILCNKRPCPDAQGN